MMESDSIKNIVKMKKIIAIIDSCITVEQFEVAKNMVDFIEFETIGDCKTIKNVLIKKDKELNGKENKI